MSISRLAGSVGLGAVLVLAFARCSPGPTQCNRYSDCDPGLTCAYGRCAFPPAPADDGGDGGGIGEAGSSIDATEEGGDETDSAIGDETSATGDDAPGDDSAADDASPE